MAADLQFTDRANKALKDAHDLAKQYAHSQVLPIHLAVSLFDPPPDLSKDQQTRSHSSHAQSSAPLFKLVIERAHGDTQAFARSLNRALVRLPSQDPPPNPIVASPSLSKVLFDANELSKKQKDSYIAVDHLIVTLAQDSKIQALLVEANVPKSKLIEDGITQLRGTKRVDSKSADADEDNENLKKFTIDMTAMAREGKVDPVIGRDEEIRRVIRILSRRTKNNPVLIGEPGVGKTTVVEGLATRIINGDVPASMATCRLLSLDVGALVAGSKYRGEFEERMKGVLKEIEDSKDEIMLFVDEIHLLMGAGATGEGGMDAANLLKPMLARGQLHCIGATTLNEYRKYIEKDQAFERRFQQVLVKEPSIKETVTILRGLKERYEVHHGVTILDSALVSAATLAGRYLTQRKLPDSAVDLIDEAAAAVRVARESQPELLEQLEQEQRELKIAIHALRQEKDSKSKRDLEEAERALEEKNEEFLPLQAKYELEKLRNKQIQDARKKLDDYKVKAADAKRSGDTGRLSDLQLYSIPNQHKIIKELEGVKTQELQADPKEAMLKRNHEISKKGRAEEIEKLQQSQLDLDAELANAQQMNDNYAIRELKQQIAIEQSEIEELQRDQADAQESFEEAIAEFKANAAVDDEESLRKKSLQNNNGLTIDFVGPEQINEIVSKWTGIPVTKLEQKERDKLLEMEKSLGQVVVGQDEAVRSVADAIRLQRSGLANPNQPPSFLFCGPSGTGKTLLTKALAEFLFDDPKAMIRFDMSEYQERHALSRMIGAPPGYVGHDAGGQLTEALRRRPFSILLFDEVEKAAKEVLTVLLQLMDDGRITDGQGRIVDAKNCIVVMTSNLGAEHLAAPSGPDGKISQATKDQVMTALTNYFLPEFLNRISSVIIFNRLSKKEIRKIVDVRMREVQKRIEENGRNINIDMGNDVKDYLGQAGYSPIYGARPLARLIEKDILNPLAIEVLKGGIRNGEKAKVILYDGRITVIPNHDTDADQSARDIDMDDADDLPNEAFHINGNGDDGSSADLYD